GGKPRGAITMAVAWEPDQLTAKGTGGEAGPDTRWLFNTPWTSSDPQGGILPMLAERVPTQENGDWVVNPDGTIVTTWKIRPNVRWHDGNAVTAQDFTFAYQAYVDPALTFRSEVERRMTSVVAKDDHTVDVTWAEPYLLANQLGIQDLGPLPRHRLEEKYQNDKANFLFGDDWTSAYVGVGPYKLDRWETGVRLIARANEDWFMGPPRLETIEVRFIPDANAILANL